MALGCTSKYSPLSLSLAPGLSLICCSKAFQSSFRRRRLTFVGAKLFRFSQLCTEPSDTEKCLAASAQSHSAQTAARRLGAKHRPHLFLQMPLLFDANQHCGSFFFLYTQLLFKITILTITSQCIIVVVCRAICDLKFI